MSMRSVCGAKTRGGEGAIGRSKFLVELGYSTECSFGEIHGDGMEMEGVLRDASGDAQ